MVNNATGKVNNAATVCSTFMQQYVQQTSVDQMQFNNSTLAYFTRGGHNTEQRRQEYCINFGHLIQEEATPVFH